MTSKRMDEAERRDIFKQWFIIPLKQRGAKYPAYAVVDFKDRNLVARYKWTAHYDGRGNISARAFCGKTQKWIMLRWLICEADMGPRPSDQHVCEHFNGDLLDCRRANVCWSKKWHTAYHTERRRAKRESDLGHDPLPSA